MMSVLEPPFRVLFEDNHCLAVEKQAGLLTAGDRTGDETLLSQVKQYLKVKYQKPGEVFVGVVHRLDRPVSGVTLFARTSKAAARLAQQFREGRAEKIYLACTQSRPHETSGNLVDWLLKDERRNIVSVATAEVPGALRAVLDYRWLRGSGWLNLIEIRPKTGRPHQIRVQLASRGWPIVGDVKYGGPPARRPGVIALHATALRFMHPTRDESILIECPLPATWSEWFGWR